jgi:tripeptide aminopeptidase
MSIRGKSGEEQTVADFIVQQLTAAGAKPNSIKFDRANQRSPVEGQTGNLIFKMPGTIRRPRRLLMAHMDTVPICVGCRPIRNGKLVFSADPKTALGADDRAGCAVVLQTALRILRDKPKHPPLTFLWTVQEEIGLHGAKHVSVSMLGKPALAFNWDGGNPTKLTVGATGGYRLQIEVEGVASHAGNAPEEGVSAIVIASLAIADLQANGWHGLVLKKGKRGSTNVGMIHGGNATNVVANRVTLRAEARSHDPKFRKTIVQAIEKAFQQAAKQVKSAGGARGTVTVRRHLDYEAFQLGPREPCVAAAKGAADAVGAKPVTQVINGAVDANAMALHGVPTVTLGCGQMNPHMVSESLDMTEFETACEIGWRLATATELEGSRREEGLANK